MKIQVSYDKRNTRPFVHIREKSQKIVGKDNEESPE